MAINYWLCNEVGKHSQVWEYDSGKEINTPDGKTNKPLPKDVTSRKQATQKTVKSTLM